MTEIIDFEEFKKEKKEREKAKGAETDALYGEKIIERGYEYIFESPEEGGKSLLLRPLTNEWKKEAPNKLQIVLRDSKKPEDKSLEEIIDCIDFEDGQTKYFSKYKVKVTYSEGNFYMEKI